MGGNEIYVRMYVVGEVGREPETGPHTPTNGTRDEGRVVGMDKLNKEEEMSWAD